MFSSFRLHRHSFSWLVKPWAHILKLLTHSWGWKLFLRHWSDLIDLICLPSNSLWSGSLHRSINKSLTSSLRRFVTLLLSAVESVEHCWTSSFSTLLLSLRDCQIFLAFSISLNLLDSSRIFVKCFFLFVYKLSHLYQYDKDTYIHQLIYELLSSSWRSIFHSWTQFLS